MDKGNGCVLLPTNEYINKMNYIVSDATKFESITFDGNWDKHPLIKFKNKIQRCLREILKQRVGNRTYYSIYPSSKCLGKLYGLAQAHKKDMPLRPVVSMVNTPQHALAKFLDRYIRELIVNFL